MKKITLLTLAALLMHNSTTAAAYKYLDMQSIFAAHCYGCDIMSDTIYNSNIYADLPDSSTNNQVVYAYTEPGTLKNINSVDAAANTDSVSIASCRQLQCRIWVKVSKAQQMLYLYVDGNLKDTFMVSTGVKKYETPALDQKPNGPVYRKYTSRKFPGGDYNGMGNMPYVIFIEGGYALHGTTRGNWSRLGKKASHGCIRLHPDNASLINALVREAGLDNTWITIEE